MSNSEFKVSIKMNSANKIIKDHGLDKDGVATKHLRDEVERLSNPYIPMKSHYLKDDSVSFPNNHSIKYNTPYARYQYYGKVMVGSPPKKVTNTDLKYNGAPKRGAHWDKRMWNDKGKDICKNVERFIRNGGEQWKNLKWN